MFFKKKEKVRMEWQLLKTIEDLESVDMSSAVKPALIFKHSTRCSISSWVLGSFERKYQPEANFDLYFLDLINNLDISNAIETRYGVQHESPQAILIRDGKVIYSASHNGIDFYEISEKAK